MSLTFESWLMLIMALTSTGTLVWTIYWSVQVREQVKAAKHDERFGDYGSRIIKLEQAVKHLPQRIATHDDVDIIHRRVSEVRAEVGKVQSDVGEIKGTLSEIRKTVGAINNVLLRGREL